MRRSFPVPSLKVFGLWSVVYGLWKVFGLFSLVFGLWSLVCGLSYADTIVTKDGKELKGIVVEDYKDRMIFSTVDGETSVMKSDVGEVYFDSEEDNLIKLAESAKDKGDYRKAYNLYNKAYKLNPDSKQVKDGMVFIQGYLFRKEESQKEEAVKKQAELERSGEMNASSKSDSDKEKTDVERLKYSTGLTIRLKGIMPEVISVKQESSAYTSGVREGDSIVAIWGKLTGYMSIEEVTANLLEKASFEEKCTIERDVNIPVDSKALLSNPKNLIGAVLKMEFDGLTVDEVNDPSPALQAGLQKGDLIVSINAQPTRYMPLKNAVRMIKFSKGNTVKFTIRRDVVFWRTQS